MDVAPFANLSSWQSCQTNILDRWFRLYSVPGDGDCFFHCISLALSGKLEETATIRAQICGYVVRHWVQFSDQVHLYHDQSTTIGSYQNYMLHGHGWATQCEIKVASLLTNCKILIYLSDPKTNRYTLQTFNETSTREMCLLLEHGHFQLLKPQCNPTNHTLAHADGAVIHPAPRITPSTSTQSDNNHSLPQDHTYTLTHTNDNKQDHNYTYTDYVETNIPPHTLIDHNYTQHTDDVEENNPPRTMYTPTSTNKLDHNYTHTNDTTPPPTTHITQDKTYTLSDACHDEVSIPCQTIHSKDILTSTKKPIISRTDLNRKREHEQMVQCRMLGATYCQPPQIESTIERKKRRIKNDRAIKSKQNNISFPLSQIPPPAPSVSEKFDKAMDSIRAFELQQLSYDFMTCTICNECHMIEKINKQTICQRCSKEKTHVKLFSDSNSMDPGKVPEELNQLTVVEQQLISRISPCINVHLLKHGGIASSGHCVTFPQEINEPAQIFPRLPSEINIIKVKKIGKNNTCKEFIVRRQKVESALLWLKHYNPAYQDIIISNERLQCLPINGDLIEIDTVEYTDHHNHKNDKGPAPEQVEVDIADNDCETTSGVLMPDKIFSVKDHIANVVKEVVGEETNVSINKKGTVTIPWPSRGDTPLSEFTTQYFFTMAFPTLFPYGKADFLINRKKTITSMSDWAKHLLWYKDGRFAAHPYFKFVVHNMIVRKRALENSKFIVNQKIGEDHLTLSAVKEMLETGDESLIKKIIYFSGSLRGTPQYWMQKGRELRSLIKYNIHNGDGLPSFFATGSCAEFHFKPLRKLLSNYLRITAEKCPNLSDRNTLFKILQQNTHIVAKYFELRTQSFFDLIMKPVFDIDKYWYRQEFAKSRGMVHWHGLCWRKDKEPHNLLHEAVQAGLNDCDSAKKLAEWAKYELGLSASHPAGADNSGNSRKNLWPPPEGTAPAPPEEKNPLVKLLMDVSENEETLLEDYLLLTNRVNIHRCSDYCLRKKGKGDKMCRMEFGTENAPGKTLRQAPEIVKDKNGSLRLEMERDHPMLVQNSKFMTQGWRANGDLSVILSKSGVKNPSVSEIIATEVYVTGYSCKGNQGTGALSDLFHDIVNSADDNAGTAKSCVTKMLMNTVKRDISAVEASFELSVLPLYRSSHTFQSVSLSGARLLEKNGTSLTKNTPLDRYICRDKDDMSSLYSFICKTGKVPVIAAQMSQPSWPLQEEYCRVMLLLHWPNWRKICDIKDENCSWVDKMHDFLKTEICPNFVRADVERVRVHSEDESNQEISESHDSEEDMDTEEPAWMKIVRPLDKFVDMNTDFQFDDGGPFYDWERSAAFYDDIGTNFIDSLSKNIREKEHLDIPNINLHAMNAHQKLAFDVIFKTLFDYTEQKTSFTPLRLIVAGTAGSGKSYLIKCLVRAIRLHFNSNKSVQVLCPTGNSANLISGVTIHRFLKIPTSRKSNTLSPPQGKTAEQLQDNLSGVKVLLVDERSLVGAKTLGWMEFMCKWGVNNESLSESSWGGLPVVVLLGDDIQLPPVLDTPVYKEVCNNDAGMHGILVWKSFTTAITLESNIRQSEGSSIFRDCLMSVRKGEVSQDQVKWLQKFQWTNLKLTYGIDISSDIEENGLYIFPTHSEESDHNKMKILKLNSKHPIAKINAECTGTHSKLSHSTGNSPLALNLFLCKDAKISLTVNLDVEYGLFNRATGKVIDIIYSEGQRPPNLPAVVMTEFPSYSGPPFIADQPKVVPIVPVERRLDCFCMSCKRKQIPLRLGWATTIHSCQGVTVGKGEPNRYIIISPGSSGFETRNPGALFVALSRAKSAGDGETPPDFAWHPSVLVNEDRLSHVPFTATTKARDREIKKIVQMSLDSKQKYKYLKDDIEFQERISLLHSVEE